MPINVVCSHCESRLNLQEDLLGKQMRCPICRDIFTVEAAPAANIVNGPVVQEEVPVDSKPATSRADTPVPKYRSGSLNDFLQVLPAQPEAPAPPGKAGPKEIVWSERASTPKEAAWSNDLLPPPDVSTDRENLAGEDMHEVGPERVEPDSPEEPPFRNDDRYTRRRKKRSRLALLVGLIFVALGAFGAGGYFVYRYVVDAPDHLIAEARKEYENKNWELARKRFDDFAAKYPDDPRAAEARFFTELSALRVAVNSSSVRADPDPAIQQLQRFLTAVEDPALHEFAGPKKFAVDIWQTARKLLEETEHKGNNVFSPDKPDAAQPWIDRAAAVGKIVEQFWPEQMDRENVYTQTEALRQKVAEAKAFLAFLADVDSRFADPDDQKILEAKREAQQRGYAAKPTFRERVDAAEQKIAGRFRYDRPSFMNRFMRLPSIRERQTASTSLLIASRLDAQTAWTTVPPGLSTVYFASARGLLYALDENGGHVLWATRTGLDADPLPLLIRGSDLFPELAIVVANDGKRSSLTACEARSGKTVWRQTLPSACIGRPVAVGQRLYVPLRDKPAAKKDEIGVILEIELASGLPIGRISLGRPLGGPIVRRPNSGQIFCPAEERGVYILDVDKTDRDGVRLDPVNLGILPTGHAAGSLRGEPIVTPGEGDQPGCLILGVIDGPESMKLQVFSLPAADQPVGTLTEPPISIPLAGWTWFPPYFDTEKLAVVTDRGEFGLFGIKQSGTNDAPLFAITPDPGPASDSLPPARGQMVYADENSFWFLARGALQQKMIGFDAKRGLNLVSRGQPIPLGEPLQAAQLNDRADTAMLVTQVAASASCRATAIDLKTGAIRWQRQLGLVAQGDPIRIGDYFIVMDRDGGLYQINTKPLAAPTDAEWLIDENWLVSPPLPDVRGPTYFFPARDGQSVFAILTTDGPEGRRLVVRHYKPGDPIPKPGEPIRPKPVPLPAPLAGNPIVVGRAVIVPLANGMLYRLFLDQDKQDQSLKEGGTWRSEALPAAVCHLTALDNEEFVGTDGARGLQRFRWPSQQEDKFERLATLLFSDRIAAPAVVVAKGENSRLVVSDAKGNITIWDANRLEANAVPVWRQPAGGQGASGDLTNGPFLDANKQIGYVVGGTVLKRLAPTEGEDKWTAKPPIRLEGKGIAGNWQVLGNRLYVTQRDGQYRVFNEENGESIGTAIRLSGSFAPAAAAVPIAENKLLAPLSDGTSRILQFKSD